MEPEYDQPFPADENSVAYKPRCEVSTGKRVVMNGQKLAGVKSFSVTYDSDNIVVLATMQFYMKNGSLKLYDDSIEFETPEYRPNGH